MLWQNAFFTKFMRKNEILILVLEALLIFVLLLVTLGYSISPFDYNITPYEYLVKHRQFGVSDELLFQKENITSDDECIVLYAANKKDEVFLVCGVLRKKFVLGSENFYTYEIINQISRKVLKSDNSFDFTEYNIVSPYLACTYRNHKGETKSYAWGVTDDLTVNNIYIAENLCEIVLIEKYNFYFFWTFGEWDSSKAPKYELIK